MGVAARKFIRSFPNRSIQLVKLPRAQHTKVFQMLSAIPAGRAVGVAPAGPANAVSRESLRSGSNPEAEGIRTEGRCWFAPSAPASDAAHFPDSAST